MARIAGINIPLNKHVVIRTDVDLRHWSHARAADLRGGRRRPDVKVKDLAEPEVEKLRTRSRTSRSKATCAAKCR